MLLKTSMVAAQLLRLIPLWACFTSLAQVVLPEPHPLCLPGDFSAQVVGDSDRFLTRETARPIAERQKYWQRDFSSAGAYDRSVEPNRERLRAIIGAADVRLPAAPLEFPGSTTNSAKIAETESFTVQAVRWPVLEGVFAEGLWLEPKGRPIACIVAIPDADQTPEMLVGLAPRLAPERQFARRLAEHGCEVLVPVLIDRQDMCAWNAQINRLTNQPHREWIYRQALPVGRHVVGYEVQKVLAAVDFFEGRRQFTLRSAATEDGKAEGRKRKIAVAGYAEGGLIAFYAAALDRRIEAAVVSGYFDSRQRLWEEPV